MGREGLVGVAKGRKDVTPEQIRYQIRSLSSVQREEVVRRLREQRALYEFTGRRFNRVLANFTESLLRGERVRSPYPGRFHFRSGSVRKGV